MLVKKQHGKTSRIILIILTLVQLQITVSVAMKHSSKLPACMINNEGNWVKQKFDSSFASVIDQEVVGISRIFSTVLETQYNDYG